MSLVWFQKLRRNFSYFRGNLLVLTLSWVFWSPAMVMVYTYEPPYILALGADEFIMGMIYGISTFILCAVRIPGGFIADRFGRKWIIAIMTFAAALTYLLFAFAPSWHWFFVAYMLSSIAIIYQPALMAAFADSIPPEQRGKGYALSNFLPGILCVFAPSVAGYFVLGRGLVEGMRILYLLAFGSGLMAAFLRLFFLKETLPRRKDDSEVGHSTTPWRGYRREYLDALKFVFRGVPLLLVLYIIIEFVSYGSFPFFAVFATEFLGLADDWWKIFMVSQAVYLIAAMPMGILTDRVGRRKVLIFSISMLVLSTLLWIVIPSHTSYAILYAATSYSLLQLAIAASNSALPAYEADLVPRLKRGSVMATLMLFSGITTAIATTISGLGYKEIAPHFPFLISLTMLLIGFPLVLFLIKEPSKREI